MRLPSKVPATSNFRKYWNALIDYLTSTHLYSSSDVIVRQSSRGTTLLIPEWIKQRDLGGESSSPWKGLWHETGSYSVGDFVYSLGTGSNDNYTYAGNWVCVETTAPVYSASVLTTGSAHPVYPYPLSGQKWHNLSLPIQLMNVTDTLKGKKAYVQGGESFTPTQGENP